MTYQRFLVLFQCKTYLLTLILSILSVLKMPFALLHFRLLLSRKQHVWNLIRLPLKEQSYLGPYCLRSILVRYIRWHLSLLAGKGFNENWILNFGYNNIYWIRSKKSSIFCCTKKFYHVCLVKVCGMYAKNNMEISIIFLLGKNCISTDNNTDHVTRECEIMTST